MPELPEVEFSRRLAEDVCLGRKIVSVACSEDPIVFQNLEVKFLTEFLLGRQIRRVARKGKYLWFEFDARPRLVVHFGMTGAFSVPERKEINPHSPDKNKEKKIWPPLYTQFLFGLSGGNQLCLVNAQRTGWVKLLEEPSQEKPFAGLGFDPYSDLPAFATFARLFQGRKTKLKMLLLDQGFVAGLGNWMADEILYQSRLAPTRQACSLSSVEKLMLYKALNKVVKYAVEVNVQRNEFPPDWLFYRRWKSQDATNTKDGSLIEHIKVGGRTTAWVPSLQH